jgi:uroporphyrinogen decarboxylase
MHYKKPDRLPFIQWSGFWSETVNRWYREGLPIGMSVHDYFGFEEWEASFQEPCDFGEIPRVISRIVSEDKIYKTSVSEMSGLKWVAKERKDGMSMPQFIEFGVKTRKDWEKIKIRYNPGDLRRYSKKWGDDLINYYNTTDRPVRIHLGSCFGWIRGLMGLEHTLVSFYKQSELIREMMEFWADFAIELVEPAIEAVRFDYATITEDIAYNNGPLISPKLFREFMLPNYKKVTGFVRSKGIDIIMVDTDGNHEALTPLFLEGGVNCLFPLEVAAGMDAIAERKKYGRELRLLGNLDKRVLSKSKEDIKQEVDSKLPFFVKDLGYIPSVDHAIPNDVPFENFKYYINLVKKYISEV